jgi:type IV pilus assembly protein PilP
MCAVVAVVACGGGGEEFERLERPSGTPAPPPSAPPPGSGTAPAAGTGAAGAGGAPAPELPVYRDEDFVESERNRDPFRSYMKAFRAQAPEEIQRRVVMPTTAVEEMRLIAIVGGIPRPKAMLVDGMNVGHVVERGVYVGRAKMIQAAGSVAMVLNWRVDRIRENEVVLTRQDPADPTRPALTRVIPLDEDADDAEKL